jgi:hypothetical protein
MPIDELERPLSPLLDFGFKITTNSREEGDFPERGDNEEQQFGASVAFFAHPE